MFVNKKALLLDMNGTFMFGEDRFGDDEDFSCYYNKLNGQLESNEINTLIRTIYHDLSEKYPQAEYRSCFPTLEKSIRSFTGESLTCEEIEKVIDTFSCHEHGYIPAEYLTALEQLARRFSLSVVIDIWSPKQRWLDIFRYHDIDKLFAASSFSSDHGIVKPSPQPFE